MCLFNLGIINSRLEYGIEILREHGLYKNKIPFVIKIVSNCYVDYIRIGSVCNRIPSRVGSLTRQNFFMHLIAMDSPVLRYSSSESVGTPYTSIQKATVILISDDNPSHQFHRVIT